MKDYRVVDLEEQKDNPEYKEVKKIAEKIQGLWIQSVEFPGSVQPLLFLEGMNPSEDGKTQILFRKGVPNELYTSKGSCGLVAVNHELKIEKLLKFINLFKEAFDIDEAPRYNEKLVEGIKIDKFYAMGEIYGREEMEKWGLVRPEHYINQDGLYDGKFVIQPKL